MLASFDPDLDRWETEEGYYDLIIARSATDVICIERVYGDWESAYTYSLATPVGTLYQEETAHKVLLEIFCQYGLDVGCMESAYEYNSHTPIGEVLNSAVLRRGNISEELKTKMYSEINTTLRRIKKK